MLCRSSSVAVHAATCIPAPARAPPLPSTTRTHPPPGSHGLHQVMPEVGSGRDSSKMLQGDPGKGCCCARICRWRHICPHAQDQRVLLPAWGGQQSSGQRGATSRSLETPWACRRPPPGNATCCSSPRGPPSGITHPLGSDQSASSEATRPANTPSRREDVAFLSAVRGGPAPIPAVS